MAAQKDRGRNDACTLRREIFISTISITCPHMLRGLMTMGLCMESPDCWLMNPQDPKKKETRTVPSSCQS